MATPEERQADPPEEPRHDKERRLRELGLSEYASRAYLALLQLGVTEARAVSRLARVPIAKVYSTLDQLAERGLCLIEPGPPKRFAAVPIERFLDRLAAEHEERAREARASKDELAAIFRMEPAAAEDDRGAFQVIRGRRATHDRLRQLFAGAFSRVTLLASDHMFERRAVMRGMIEAAHARGVRVQVLARVDAAAVPALVEMQDVADVRAKEPQSAAHIAVAIVDEQRALVVHFVPDDGRTNVGNDVALYTDEEAIVGALYGFLVSQWERAEPLADARSRVERGQPRRFHRSLRSEADAIMAATRVLEEGAGDHRVLAPRVADVLLPRLPAAARERCITRILTREDLAAANALRRARPTLELRHAAFAPALAYDVLDGRVALLAFRPSGEAGASYQFTNDSPTVWAMLEHFEDAWSRAVPLEERARELEEKEADR